MLEYNSCKRSIPLSCKTWRNTMPKTINPESKSQQTLAARTRFTFGRTFLATLAAGEVHRDAGKLSVFLVANGAETPESIMAKAEKQEVTLESLSQAAKRVIEHTKPENLVMKYTLN